MGNVKGGYPSCQLLLLARGKGNALIGHVRICKRHDSIIRPNVLWPG